MRQVLETIAAACGSEVGVEWRWIPGSQVVRLQGQIHGREMGVKRKRYGSASWSLLMTLRL